jgi:hypothetical protein
MSDNHEHTEPFRAPVDWKGLGLDNYPKIVKKPMDLGTVLKKLGSGAYEDMDSCAADIRLIWTNCMTFNQVFVMRKCPHLLTLAFFRTEVCTISLLSCSRGDSRSSLRS